MVVAAVISAFVVAAIPAIIFMTVWTAVTVFRVVFPERPLPFEANRAAERQAARERGETVVVGFREIHEDMRTHARKLARPYHHIGGCSGGFPESWIEDLYARRN